MNKTDTVVIGGGISGLSAAWGLVQAGRDVTLIESDNRTGGVIQTLHDGEWQTEAGPNTLLVKPALFSLMQSLGLTETAQLADRTSARRYVVVDGKMQALPSGPGSALVNPLVRRALPGILREPWVGRASDPDESVADFVTRRLGPQVLRNFVDPFVSGIFGGDPARLSVHAAFPRLAAAEDEYGSVLRAAFAHMRNRPTGPRLPKEWRGAIVSFPDGLGTLPQKLSERLQNTSRVITNTAVTALSQTSQGWLVTAGDQTWLAHNVILATPAYISAHLLQNINPELAGLLDQIFYAPMCSVSLGFRSEDITHTLDGFGVLIPRPENRRTLGALFSSTLFPDRCPQGTRLLTAFVGGRLYPDATGLADTDLINLVTQDLQDLLGLRGSPVWSRILRWHKAIPQYEIGYPDRMARIGACLKDLPGLELIGNWRGGISMVDCIANGLAVANLHSDTV